MITKPFKRTVRQFTDGTYSNSGKWMYLLHPSFANEPQHYIRAYLIIQEDLKTLFEYVEPCDQNCSTISLKIHELLVRTCIEVEANFTAILTENRYSIEQNRFNIKDYCLIEFSHRLSAYQVRFPLWNGKRHTRRPFKNWDARGQKKDWHVLDWYQAYNKCKHDRQKHFNKATLEHLLDAIAGLVVLLESQFMGEDYSPHPKISALEGPYSYGYDPVIESAIGGYFMVKYPDNWEADEQYGFDWKQLKNDPEPIDTFDYDGLRNSLAILHPTP